MNEMMFLRIVNESLRVRKHIFQKELSKTYKPQYFEKFKDNIHYDWGQVCLALKYGEEKLQSLYDEAEIVMNNKKECDEE